LNYLSLKGRMDSSLLNFISEGDFEIDSTAESFPRLQLTLEKMKIPYYKSLTEEEKRRLQLLQKLEKKLERTGRPKIIKLEDEWEESTVKPFPLCESLTEEEREYKLKELERLDKFYKKETTDIKKLVKDSINISNTTFLLVSNDYWLKNGSNNISKLAFFLKDYGLEFIYPFYGKKSKDKFYFGFRYYSSDDTSDDKPMHITDFMKISTTLDPWVLFEEHFNDCLNTYLNGPETEEYDKPYKHDWEKEGLDTAFEGNASNMWNVD
jgi:hypothetical protein